MVLMYHCVHCQPGGQYSRGRTSQTAAIGAEKYSSHQGNGRRLGETSEHVTKVERSLILAPPRLGALDFESKPTKRLPSTTLPALESPVPNEFRDLQVTHLRLLRDSLPSYQLSTCARPNTKLFYRSIWMPTCSTGLKARLGHCMNSPNRFSDGRHEPLQMP